MDPNTSTCLAVLVTAAVACYVWQRKDFVIRVRSGQVRYWGRIALAQQPELTQFLLEDLRLKGPVTISGKRWGRRLHLGFRGPVGRGDQQRVRNFLLTRRL